MLFGYGTHTRVGWLSGFAQVGLLLLYSVLCVEKVPQGRHSPLGMWLGSQSRVCEKGAPSCRQLSVCQGRDQVRGPDAGGHPALLLTQAPLCVFSLHTDPQHLHLGNRGPDAGRIRGLAHVSTGLNVLRLRDWPSVCRAKLRCLPDSVPPVYRLRLLMDVRGANTHWFYRLID